MSSGRSSSHPAGAESPPVPGVRLAVSFTLQPADRDQYETHTFSISDSLLHERHRGVCLRFAIILLFRFHNVCLFLTGTELLGSLIRILQFNAEWRESRTAGNAESEESQKEEVKQEEDEQLKALVETTAEFLSAVLMQLNKVKLAAIQFTK